MTAAALKATRRQAGIALLIVLWGCTLAAITLGALATSARVEGIQARGQSQSVVARYAAEGAIAQAAYRLRATDDALRWKADGTLYSLREGRTRVTVTIQDEAGKINLNRATPEVIENVLRAVGLAPEQARKAKLAIVAWGTGGQVTDSLLERGGFSSLEELWRVPGLDPGLVKKLLPLFTLWSLDETNLAHAPVPVLMALTGADRVTCEAYADALKARTTDDEAVLPAIPNRVLGRVAFQNGPAVTIVASAQVEGGVKVTLEVTLLQKSDPGDPQAYRVVRWHELSADDDGGS